MNGNGKEYALAMFSIALENDNMEDIHSDLMSVKSAIEENPEYLGYLVNPAIPKSERLENIKAVFEERVCEEVFSFLNVLCEHGDMYTLDSAITEFEAMYEDHMQFANAVVTSAVELTDDQKARLIAKLSKVTSKKIRAEYVIDKNILGGLTITVDGTYYDGSIRKNLNNIKEVMS